MRTAALTLIIICEIIIALTKNANINEGFLSFMLTLIVVVIVAFTFSAILQNFKNLALTKNYMISGIAGVVVGFLFYSWIGDHLVNLIRWLENYGLFVLLIIIFLSALMLYFSNHSNTKKTKDLDNGNQKNAAIESKESADSEGQNPSTS